MELGNSGHRWALCRWGQRCGSGSLVGQKSVDKEPLHARHPSAPGASRQ